MSGPDLGKLRAKLHDAEGREAARWAELALAAQTFWLAMERGSTDDVRAAADGLRGAAKRHTNAEHQTSRCRKHLREAGGDA